MKRQHKLTIAAISIIIALTLVAPTQVLAAYVGNTEISSKGAVVMDFDTGLVLYSYNENTQRVPASTLKILAAYVIYDAVSAGEISFSTTTRISKGASELSKNREYSNVPLAEGASYRISQLMEVVLVSSACAATLAMGEALSGSEKAFIERMKNKAAKLGVDTRLYDCWGGSPNNRISSLGMATLARGLITEHPEVLNITSKRTVTFDGITYNSSNLLLGQYAGVDGLKTGYTDPAGYCLISTAKQKGRRIIAVTMGSTLSSRYPDTRALLDYGFSAADKIIAEYNGKYLANPSSANLILNGETTPLSAYLINDSHYFKLRDIAFLLSGTDVRFQVLWSSVDNSVNLMGGMDYTPEGGELSLPFEGARPYDLTQSSLYFNGVEYEFEAYFIDDYNYFRLRDLGDLISFGVDWENETHTVIINT
ncbi:MAG: D-alanyl-D-alanine carboxypeptidase [Oscillospiraceae bacterium]|nr:D-alanyl-D-alanine carboxypeptidase [Oscillospiraceae bacterium]